MPASREEVGAITRLYAPRAVAYLGGEATEERAKALGREPRIVHFACHAILNGRFPLDSALALTIPGKAEVGRENGLLQAWEVFESVRLEADLVTLSSCESGLGTETAGEGLVGLTRAFQLAGARSVLAALWRVADEPTRELMTRFYQGLREGRTKDEALRRAQLGLLHAPRHPEDAVDLSRPVHWAAFELFGDWMSM